MADKLVVFVDKLRQRTAEGKIEWEVTAEEGTYQAAFPNYTVQFFVRETGRTDRDFVIQILDENGTLVEEITDVDYQRLAGLDAREAFLSIEDTYKRARRKAMGVNKALDNLIESLGDDTEW